MALDRWDKENKTIENTVNLHWKLSPKIDHLVVYGWCELLYCASSGPVSFLSLPRNLLQWAMVWNLWMPTLKVSPKTWIFISEWQTHTQSILSQWPPLYQDHLCIMVIYIASYRMDQVRSVIVANSILILPVSILWPTLHKDHLSVVVIL